MLDDEKKEEDDNLGNQGLDIGWFDEFVAFCIKTTNITTTCGERKKKKENDKQRILLTKERSTRVLSLTLASIQLMRQCLQNG